MRKLSYAYHVIQHSTGDPLQPSIVTAAPPPIPASHTGPEWLTGLHLLLWVHTGAARVHQQDGSVHRLAAGEGVWIPAGIGRRIETDPGSVAFPNAIVPDTVPTVPADPVRFSVPDEWRDWLILHFAHQVAPISSFGYTQTTLLDVLGPKNRAPVPPASERSASEYPPLPVGAGARTVAEELLRNPALDHTVEAWAALVAYSPSTLRREFRRDTAMTFAQWRNRCRLAVACEFLTAGFEVAHVAAHAGFASRNGFTRAFGELHGIAPRDYVSRSRNRSGSQSARIAAAQRSGLLTRLITGPPEHRDLSAAQRTLPGTRTALHVNDAHVLTWSYRGTGYLRIGETIHERGRGEAVWIPAGVEHEAGTHHESLGLPIGTVDVDAADVTRPLKTRYPPSWDTYLLHCSVSDRSRLRPEGFDQRHILDIFREQVSVDRPRGAPLPSNPQARALAQEFLRRMDRFEIPLADPAVHRAFVAETGMTVARWQRAARMHVARELLAQGAKPVRVARQVGYARMSNFSRAFSGFHGISPREFQHRERT